MMDLHDRLGRLAGPAAPATEDQATADLARGRLALRRRRTVKSAATGVFAVAAATAAIAYGAADRPASHPAPSAAAPVTADRPGGAPAEQPGGVTAEQPGGATAKEPAVITARLVAYQGAQPKGYTIDKVPAGWEIQGVDNYVLTIAPVNAKDKDKDKDSFVGKIAVMLQSKDQKGTPAGTALRVGGKPGVLVTGDQPGSKSLYVKQPNGVNLIIQIWDARGWSNPSIVQFGAGIHVLATAQQGVG
jgi:hypothetical protein